MPTSVPLPLDEAVQFLRDAAAAGAPIYVAAHGVWLDPDGNRPSREHTLDLSGVSPYNAETNASTVIEAIKQWPDDPDRFAVELVFSAPYPCPCCGHLMFSEPPGSYEICSVCFWEDDPVQLRWPTVSGGANRPSLIEAQRTYAEIGAKEYRVLDYVHPPKDDEPLDPGWRPIDPDVDVELLEDSHYPADHPYDETALYWWRPTYWRSRQ